MRRFQISSLLYYCLLVNKHNDSFAFPLIFGNYLKLLLLTMSGSRWNIVLNMHILRACWLNSGDYINSALPCSAKFPLVHKQELSPPIFIWVFIDKLQVFISATFYCCTAEVFVGKMIDIRYFLSLSFKNKNKIQPLVKSCLVK